MSLGMVLHDALFWLLLDLYVCSSIPVFVILQHRKASNTTVETAQGDVKSDFRSKEFEMGERLRIIVTLSSHGQLDSGFINTTIGC